MHIENNTGNIKVKPIASCLMYNQQEMLLGSKKNGTAYCSSHKCIVSIVTYNQFLIYCDCVMIWLFKAGY